MQTVVREYASTTERDAEMARHAGHGWSVQSVTHERGRYRARRGFALAVVATPVAALLAGNGPDRWVVVYSAAPGTPEPPPAPPGFVAPPRAVEAAEQRAALRWAARWFGLPLATLVLLGLILVLVALQIAH